MKPASEDSVSADYMGLSDEELLAQCDVNVHRASGPGGQHRNKVSSAVRLVHRPTRVSAQAYDSRSQHENRRTALKRLRMNIACRVRRAVDPASPEVPEVVASCVFAPRGRGAGPVSRLEVGRKDQRFWPVAAFLLDLLDSTGGRLSPAAGAIGVTTSNLVSVLKQDRHLLAAAQTIRKRHGLGGLK